MRPARLVVSLILAVLGGAFAQELPTATVGRSIAGYPTHGAPGIRESVASIMQRQRKTPKRTEPYFKYQEHEGPERDGLPNNPLSPHSSQWPLPQPSAFGLEKPKPNPVPRFSVGGDYEGATFNDAFAWPPDTMGDVSPTQVLICINGRIRVFDKQGNVGGLDADTDTFFASVKRASTFTTDPRVRYDRLSGRWIVLMIDAKGTSSDVNNRLMIAVSDGSTITSSSNFTFYQFAIGDPAPAGDSNAFFDYPTLGVDANALYVGGNCFYNTGQYSTSMFVIRKSSLLNGGPIVVSAFRQLMDTSTFVGPNTPQGVDNDDPDSTDGYVIGVDGAAWGLLDVRKITNPGGTPVLSAMTQLTVPDTKYPYNPIPLGSSRALDALDDRLFVAKIGYNPTTGRRTLWTAHNIGVDNTGVATNSPIRTGSRWYEIDVSGTPSLVQSGTVYDSTSNATSYWIPSMVMSRQGSAVLGFSSGGPNQRTAISFSQRLSTDAAGTMSAPVNVVTSTASYNDQSGLSTQRWGDYSHTVVDPADGMTLWTFQMLAKTNTAYAVHFVKLVAPPPATISSVSPTTAAQGATVTFTVDGTSSAGSGFFDPGTGFTNHIAAAFSGTGITVTDVTYVSPTEVTVTADIDGAAATGDRDLTITNPDGQTTTFSAAFKIDQGFVKIDKTSAVGGSTPYPVLTVTLPSAAPSGGTTVTLSSDQPSVARPAAYVVVPAGSTSAHVNVTTYPVSSNQSATISASGPGLSGSASLTVTPPEIKAFWASPTSIMGGTSAVVTFRLGINAKAPTGGQVITITSSDPANLPVPASITIPAGAYSTSFTASPKAVTSNDTVTVTATTSGKSSQTQCTIKATTLYSVTVTPTSVYGGTTVHPKATVRLTGPAPEGGLDLTVTSSKPTDVVLDSTTAHIDAGSMSGYVTMTVPPANTSVNSTISATLGVTKSAILYVKPPELWSMTISPSSLTGTSSATLTVKLNAPAGDLGRRVLVSTSDTTVAKFPAQTVVVPAGETTATMVLTTFAVDSPTSVTLTGTSVVTKSTDIMVKPAQLTSIAFSTSAVVGDSATVVTGTVTLDRVAGPSGRTVHLMSSDASATVPETVFVPSGSRTVQFTLGHTAVDADKVVTITASLDEVSKTRNITIKH